MSAAQARQVTAEEVVAEVADRLADPEAVARITGATDNVDRPPGQPPSSPWQPTTLVNGHPGIALLFAELAATDDRHRGTAHAHLAAAVRRADQAGAGLSAGLTGIAFAANAAGRAAGGYRRLLDQLDVQVRRECTALVDAERERIRARRAGVPIAGYDLISGLTGIGAYLLARGHHQLESVLTCLVRLTDPVTAYGLAVPGWWTPDRPFLVADDERYGRGHLNVGVAHGIGGPLALLSLAWTAGVRVARQRDAVERIARWLLEHRRVDPTDGCGWWPGDVPFDEQVGGRREQHLADRAAWCYGTPGVARALQLAGLAFDQPRWQRTAVAAMVELLARPDRTATDAGLCHGSAGLLWLTSRMARDCTDPDLRAGLAVDALIEEVLAQYDPSAPFGFRYTAQHAIVAPDRPGFLEGAAGIALVLTGHAVAASPSTGWDAALLTG